MSAPSDYSQAAAKVRSFPQTPGVYLMKDNAGRVIYVGKAKNLRSRAGSYFLKSAAEDPRTAGLVRDIRDIDCLETESEIDALLLEARLIKDILPRYNKDLRDDKTFPYLEIHLREDFPRVGYTRKPNVKGTKLYGPFANPRGLRGAIHVLQKVFKFRTCMLDISTDDPRWRWFRPCLLHAIDQCTAPCNLRISKEAYCESIKRLQKFLEGKRKPLLKELRQAMEKAAGERRYEEAAAMRDEIEMLESLDQRGDINRHEQPEVFPVDPKKGLSGLQKVLGLARQPRIIEGVDIAHLGGNQTVAALVQFIDGLPFKPGYRRMKIRSVEGVDDYASIGEAIARHYHRRLDQDETFPDILLIDGGRGQLNAALRSFHSVDIDPPTVISLAKKNEEIFIPEHAKSLQLSRRSYALRLLQYVRDEAHRFAQHYHHILRRRSQLGK